MVTGKTEDTPILFAYYSREGMVAVWCKHCEVWHQHKTPKMLQGEYTQAHCPGGRPGGSPPPSPYLQTGYCFHIKGQFADLTAEQRQNGLAHPEHTVGRVATMAPTPRVTMPPGRNRHAKDVPIVGKAATVKDPATADPEKTEADAENND